MRNDDYGGHLLHRFHRSIQTLGELALKHALTVELVVVEWNPPPDTPRLRDALLWPDSLLDVLIVAPARPPARPPVRRLRGPEAPRRHRQITVPAETHARLGAPREWQYEAKNVGVQRARGAFVLTTNADVILSDAAVALIAWRPAAGCRRARPPARAAAQAAGRARQAARAGSADVCARGPARRGRAGPGALLRGAGAPRPPAPARRGAAGGADRAARRRRRTAARTRCGSSRRGGSRGSRSPSPPRRRSPAPAPAPPWRPPSPLP